MESVERFTKLIYRQHERNAEDFNLMIPKTLFEADGLISEKQSSIVVEKAHRVVEFIGVGPSLIGIVNLCSVAYGLVIRSRMPDMWNQFCYEVDRPEWIADTEVQKSRVSRSAKTPVATSCEDAAQQRTDVVRVDCSEEHVEDRVKLRHTGMAAALNDHEFNKKIDELLDGSNEDRNTEQTVITGNDCHPRRVSRFDPVIQEKYNAARYRRKTR